MLNRAEDLQPTKHARRRMRLYGITLGDLVWLMDNVETETPSRERGRKEIDGPTPDGRRLRLIVPTRTREVIVTVYPLS
jgi:hypothetical protein